MKKFICLLALLVNALEADCCPYPCWGEKVYSCYVPHGNGFAAVEGLCWSSNYHLPYPFSLDFLDTPILSPLNTDTHVEIARAGQSWDPGYRIIVGWDSDADDWFFRGIYSYYYTHTTKNSGSLRLNPDTFFNEFHARENLRYNAADVEVGKEFTYTSIKVRPFFGPRYVYINHTHTFDLANTLLLASTSAAPASSTSATPTHSRFDQYFWAIGPRLGVDTEWGHFYGLSLLCNGSFSLLYGRGHTRGHFTVVTSTEDTYPPPLIDNTNLVLVRDNFYKLFPTIQLFIGAAWTRFFNNGKNALKVKAGWETNYYWEAANVLFVERSISFQGLTATLELDF